MAKTPRLNYADASNPGLLSAGAQVIPGLKTLPSGVTLGGPLTTQAEGSADMTQRRFSADTAGPVYYLEKARGTTAAPATPSNGDVVGEFLFRGSNGGVGGWLNAASIRGVIDGTTSPADMPGKIVFSTTADGSSNYTDRMTILNNGRVGIGTAAPNQTMQVLGPISAGFGVSNGTPIAIAYAQTSYLVLMSNQYDAGSSVRSALYHIITTYEGTAIALAD